MCILAFITNYSTRLPFILISNRDELLSRQTLELSWHHFAKRILCALDVLAGGTWMGLEREHGRFAIITNCRRPPAAALRLPQAKSSCTSLCTSPMETSITANVSTGNIYSTSTLQKSNELEEQKESLECHSKRTKCVESGWRGAAPLSEIVNHTKVKCIVNSSLSNTPERVLYYDPPTSRGTIVKDYLEEGCLPDHNIQTTEKLNFDAGVSVKSKEKCFSMEAPSRSLYPPYYAGYNLLTCPSLFGTSKVCTDNSLQSSHNNTISYGSSCCNRSNEECTAQSASAFAMHYTTNRYGVEYDMVLEDKTIHCLQNSYLDNWDEPKCTYLRTLFEETLSNNITPLLSQRDHASSTHSLSDLIISSMASDLADHCLNATPNFDLLKMINGSNTVNLKQKRKLYEILHSNDPLSGFTDDELVKWWGHGANFSNGDAFMIENELQRNIFTKERCGYATRVQSVVLVEALSVLNEEVEQGNAREKNEREYIHNQNNKCKAASQVYVVHFMQRATPAENAQDCSWKHFKLRSDD